MAYLACRMTMPMARRRKTIKSSAAPFKGRQPKRSTALDLMRAHPDLKGFLAFGSQGPIGAARAVAERHLGGKVVVMGPFSPGQGKKLVHDGVLTGGYMWNPELAGEVFVSLGAMVAGRPLTAPARSSSSRRSASSAQSPSALGSVSLAIDRIPITFLTTC